MNLLGYWRVLKSERRVVVVGLAVTCALSLLALFRIAPDGVSLRTPRVYDAKSTLFVTKGQSPAGDPGPTADYQAQIYAQLAHSDAVRRLVDPTLRRELEYDVQSVTGSLGTPLPIILITAFAASPQGAIALANRVGDSLRQYVVTSQADARIPRGQRSRLSIVARPEEAEIFRGIRLTPALMLFVLGITGTVFIAFTRHNLALGRRSQGDQHGHQVHLAESDAGPGDTGSIPLQPVERRTAGEQRLEAPGAGRGRWTSR